MEDKKKLDIKGLRNQKRKIRKRIRLKQQEILHLERLEREIGNKMQKMKDSELRRKKVNEELRSGKSRFTKRALLNVLKEIREDDNA